MSQRPSASQTEPQPYVETQTEARVAAHISFALVHAVAALGHVTRGRDAERENPSVS